MLVVAVCAGLDLITKAWARQALEPLEVRLLPGGVLELHRIENPVLAWGLGAGLPEPARFWVFGVGVALVGVAALAWGAAPRRQALARAGAWLLAGGLLGNTLDRWLSAGRVLDFLALRVGPYVTDIFNLADLAIGLGAALVAAGVALGWRGRRRAG
jgi:signal peptidase II